MEQFTKVGFYNKTGSVPRPQPQAVTEHMMQLGGQMKSVKVKVNTIFALSSLIAYSNKSPRLIVMWKIVEVYGCTGTISHFGERFRGEQYT